MRDGRERGRERREGKAGSGQLRPPSLRSDRQRGGRQATALLVPGCWWWNCRQNLVFATRRGTLDGVPLYRLWLLARASEIGGSGGGARWDHFQLSSLHLPRSHTRSRPQPYSISRESDSTLGTTHQTCHPKGRWYLRMGRRGPSPPPMGEAGHRVVRRLPSQTTTYVQCLWDPQPVSRSTRACP